VLASLANFRRRTTIDVQGEGSESLLLGPLFMARCAEYLEVELSLCGLTDDGNARRLPAFDR
jgi:hypothetical protein